MKSKWLRYFSPCLLMVYFILVSIVWSYVKNGKAQGWTDLAAYALLPFMIGFLVVDWVLKIWVKKVGWLWVFEVAIIVAVWLWFFNK